jgi:hypothetical protein
VVKFVTKKNDRTFVTVQVANDAAPAPEAPAEVPHAAE